MSFPTNANLLTNGSGSDTNLAKTSDEISTRLLGIVLDGKDRGCWICFLADLHKDIQRAHKALNTYTFHCVLVR